MASAAAATPPPAQRSFAGLLEEYAAPVNKFPPARDLDGLEDDVTTLTYEHALRMNARYRAEPVPLAPNLPADGASGLPAPQTKPHGVAANPTRAEQNTEPSPRSRKSASVTVRLTAAEDSQFRARAAEAGLTVSAYLRSCAFEIEDLRAQVKQALVHMREIEQQSPAPSPGWLSRLLRRVPRSG